MSLHPYLVPPPLALAIHPAPPAKPEQKSKGDAKDDCKGKDDGKGQDKVAVPEDGKIDENGEKAPDAQGDGARSKAGADGKAMPQGDGSQGGIADVKIGQVQPPTPATSGSRSPETPNAVPGHGDQPAPAHPEGIADKGKEGGVDDAPAHKRQTVSATANDDGAGTKEDAKPGVHQGPESKSDSAEEAEPEPEPEPIRLISPAPPRPIRTRMDLQPGKAYPPINTDPRGAYHKYAKAVGQDWILVDVTKDGWLAEQWKERTEREALKRLTGEWELELQREMEKQRKREEIKQVPRTAEGILLDLWNELVQAKNHEMPADVFWSFYDWTPERTKVHLRDIQREVAPPAKADAGLPENGATDNGDVEWTKSGLEEILATVGVQCAYNTHKPIGKHWLDPPSSAYLLMSHGHFLLRNGMYLQFKPEKAANQFEVLVTSGHDRVFGNMVKAQREKEYKERKDREKKEKAKAKAEAEAKGDEVIDGGKEKEEGKGDEGIKDERGKDSSPGKAHQNQASKDSKGENKAAITDKEAGKGAKDAKVAALEVDGDVTPQEGPMSPASNVRVIDGEPVQRGEPKLADQGEGVVAVVDVKRDAVMVAVPVGPGGDDANLDAQALDAKHEQEAVVVPGPKPAVVDKRTSSPADPRVPDEAQTKAKANDKAMSPDRPMNMNQIAQAFQALEAAINPKPVDLNAADTGPEGDKTKVAVIWTWAERCEMWRWKNWEQGVAVLEPGCWEERDWKVFADDREVWDYDADEAIIELEEADVHDWSM
ncbi:hypothetical protein IAU60_002314 [Kwoniella sp. DSM 27419]